MGCKTYLAFLLSQDMLRLSLLLLSNFYCLASANKLSRQEKDLDNTENVEEAIALIGYVVSVFDYMRQPDVQGKIRSIHNRLRTEIDIFQDALNALYTARGEPVPTFNLTSLWEEYMR